MARKRYMLSEGLAFLPEKDMEKLRKKSLQGWLPKGFWLFGYKLEKGDPEDVIFSIDYRVLQRDEEDEYFAMFESAGWTHVCSEGMFHMFKAEKGTTPIYSDVISSMDQLDRVADPIRAVLVFGGALTTALFLLTIFTYGLARNISRLAFMISLALTVPAIMTYSAIFYRKWKMGRTI